ncbi:acyl--CoA ligase [Pseudonocardia sp. RS11V-5]|uniref:class I adenylate-forming enzyme family protein n=1 Tax=Pseudonocardia terrae TaxID=2905831 RepID=UPI001E3B0C45|nr:class I adenylate-forming enzyme family protein [Pseudonocardia terrae]MCE3550873.1 acyl--CoA ligase [Pseudonocardia terrae]
MSMELVGDIIRLHAVHRSHDPAIVFRDKILNYGELNALTNRTAAALAELGVGHGDRVVVLAKNSPEYVALYFATAKLGAILVPLSFWQRAGELARVIDEVTPALALYEDDLADLMDNALAGASRAPRAMAFGLRADTEAAAGRPRFSTEGRSGVEPETSVSGADPHLIIFTSGTTGVPKGAMLSQRRTVDDAFACSLALAIRSDDTFLAMFPAFHVGLWDHIKLYLLVGARTILLREFHEVEALRAIEEQGTSVILSAPVMWRRIIDAAGDRRPDLSSIRLAFLGGSADRTTHEVVELLGVREGRAELAHQYGQTEAGPFICLCDPQHVFEKWGSIGRPLPGVDVVLLDDDGNPCPDGQAGEICVRGPMMTGYWQNPSETARALDDGLLHTGDVAVRDADGFYFIVDRKKEMIRSGGQNVYCKQVEEQIRRHPDVADVAVVGVPDELYGESVLAAVVLTPTGKATDDTAEELKQYVRRNIAGYNVPKYVVFEEELPRNAVGRVLKHIMREQYKHVPTGHQASAR